MFALWAAITSRGRFTILLGALLVLAGVGWHYPIVLGMGSCLLLLVGAELVAVRAGGGITLSREIEPRVVTRHGECTGTLEVIGRQRNGLVRTDAADQVDGVLLPIELPIQGRAREVRVDYQIPTPRRGLIDVGPLRLRRYGLAGMAATSDDAGSVDQVRVLPRRIPVASLIAGVRRAAGGGDDSMELGGTDLVGLHEYVMGDDLRRLHWATTARTGTLMVREDAEPSEPHLCLILDDRAESYPEPDDFEEAVEFVAGVAALSIENGRPTRLRLTSGRDEIVVGGSTHHDSLHDARDVDYLLAEIALVAGIDALLPGSRDLDVAVLCTGPTSEYGEAALILGDAPTRVLAQVDRHATVGAGQQGGLLILRGATSVELAARWDAVAR